MYSVTFILGSLLFGELHGHTCVSEHRHMAFPLPGPVILPNFHLLSYLFKVFVQMSPSQKEFPENPTENYITTPIPVLPALTLSLL